MNKYSETSSKVGSIQYLEGATIRLILDKEESGKCRLYFLVGDEVVPSNPTEVGEYNIPFISFVQNKIKDRSNEISLTGMYVPPEKRGTNFSDIMMTQFFQMIQSSGFILGKTAQIKKPLLAAKLAKIGFIPERSDVIARIIGITRENVPIVAIDKNTREGNHGVVSPRNISTKAKNLFYTIVGDESNQGKRVALQTIYIPPGDASLSEYIEKHRKDVLGKIRIFPSRVKGVLNQKK